MSEAVVEFLAMGDHGLYVWLAYGIGFAILGGLGIRPLVVRRRLIRRRGARGAKAGAGHAMNRVRRGRLIATVFLLAGTAATVGFVLAALKRKTSTPSTRRKRSPAGQRRWGSRFAAAAWSAPGSVSWDGRGPRGVVRADGLPGVGLHGCVMSASFRTCFGRTRVCS